MISSTRFDEDAALLAPRIPAGFRVGVIGSTSFWHDESEQTCLAIGRALAEVENVVVVTGGVPGVGDRVGWGFAERRRELGRAPNVIHVLPHDCNARPFGTTLFAGDDMTERREILGRLASIYVAVEGGPGTEHEVAVAMARGALLVPVGRSGGCAGEIYQSVVRRSLIGSVQWQTLGDPDATAQEVAEAVRSVVDSVVRRGA